MKQNDTPETTSNGETSVDGIHEEPEVVTEQAEDTSLETAPEAEVAEAEAAEEAPVSDEYAAEAEVADATVEKDEYGNDIVVAEGEYDVDGEESDASVEEERQFIEEPKDKRPVRYAFLGLFVGLIVGSCGWYAATGVQELIRSANATVITAAVTECGLDDKEGITVSDNGKRLNIDTKGEADESGATGQNAVCLVQTLQVPVDVIEKLDATPADAERQTTSWESRELSWEFKKDTGISMEYLLTK